MADYLLTALLMRSALTLCLALGLISPGLAAQNHLHSYYRSVRVVRAPSCPRSDSLIGPAQPTPRPGVVRGAYSQEQDSTLVVTTDPVSTSRWQRFIGIVRFAGWLPDSIPDLDFYLVLDHHPGNRGPASTDSVYGSLGDGQYVGLGVPTPGKRRIGMGMDIPDSYRLQLTAQQFEAFAGAEHPSFILGRYRWDLTPTEQLSLQALFRAAACSLDPLDH